MPLLVENGSIKVEIECYCKYLEVVKKYAFSNT